MYWDYYLEKIAQDWANKCEADSDGVQIINNPNRNALYGSSVGENIFVSTEPQALDDIIQDWFDERLYYDYCSNSCKDGQECNHFTQIVWASAYRVGCGRSYCSNLLNPHVFVCNYAPIGNTIGQRPYNSYYTTSYCRSRMMEEEL